MSSTKTDSAKEIEQRYDNISVLIVEDDPQTARLVLEILARKGISAQLAAHKKAALDALDNSRYDLVFLSAELGHRPDRSPGFELIDAIRNNAPEMPIIMVAGPQEGTSPAEHNHSHQQPGDGNLLRLGTQTAVKAIQAGCRDFLLKPIASPPPPPHTKETAASIRSSARVLSSPRPSPWPRESPPPPSPY
ncbi:MAG: response regulator [Planctomycetota bacterium]